MTLLEKAKSVPVHPRRHRATADGLPELAIEWARGQVRTGQIASALAGTTASTKTSASLYCALARGFCIAVQTGLLVESGSEARKLAKPEKEDKPRAKSST